MREIGNLEHTRYKNIIMRLLNEKDAFGVTTETINASDGLIVSFGKPSVENDYLPRLLLEHGADPNKKSKYPWTDWSPVLKAAGWRNLPLLNLFIDEYNGDINQTRKGETVFYIAFMKSTVQGPDEITYFKNLNALQKKEFMEKELTIVMDKVPHYNFLEDIDDDFDKDIKRLNEFVATCVQYVGKEDKSNIKTLLEAARKNAQERHNNFSQSKKHMYEKECESIYHCRCEHSFQFNELMVHALIPHADIEDSDKKIANMNVVDKQIAEIYKETPSKYYLQYQYEKEEQKKALLSTLGSS